MTIHGTERHHRECHAVYGARDQNFWKLSTVGKLRVPCAVKQAAEHVIKLISLGVVDLTENVAQKQSVFTERSMPLCNQTFTCVRIFINQFTRIYAHI